MLRTSELEYDLPEERIAREPASPRDAARLMVVPRTGGAPATDATVRDLPRFLRSGDLLVFNTTKVLPARLVGEREDTRGKMEGLFLSSSQADQWTVMLRAKHVRPGMRFALYGPDNKPGGVVLESIERDESEPGAWRVRVLAPDPAEVLSRIGRTPLPPYILKARDHAHQTIPDAADRDSYQTVYANRPGSVAAPTAGLHFTPELLERLSEMGVQRADVTLHVGTGTFRPVETDVVEEHPMHTERCSIGRDQIRLIHDAVRDGRRVIAVGTTSARTLESYAMIGSDELPDSIDTRLLITPGYQWKWVSGLLTNFHLPRSTLLSMVGAFLQPPRVARLRELYGEAISRGYRFYSYGDAMLVI